MLCKECGKSVAEGEFCTKCFQETLMARVETLEEFMVDQVGEAYRRVTEAENESVALRAEVSQLREEVKQCRQTPTDWSPMSSSFASASMASTSTPKQQRLEFKIPSNFEDITDEEMRDNLEMYTSLISTQPMSISKVQQAFIMHWVDTQPFKVTGHLSQITNLISAGVKEGIWEKGWVPVGIKDWPAYLQDKVKKYNQKKN